MWSGSLDKFLEPGSKYDLMIPDALRDHSSRTFNRATMDEEDWSSDDDAEITRGRKRAAASVDSEVRPVPAASRVGRRIIP